jgi:hypothetical protein
MYINYGVLSTKHFGDRFEICPLIFKGVIESLPGKSYQKDLSLAN